VTACSNELSFPLTPRKLGFGKVGRTEKAKRSREANFACLSFSKHHLATFTTTTNTPNNVYSNPQERLCLRLQLCKRTHQGEFRNVVRSSICLALTVFILHTRIVQRRSPRYATEGPQAWRGSSQYVFSFLAYTEYCPRKKLISGLWRFAEVTYSGVCRK
jgi:hypothetical protein